MNERDIWMANRKQVSINRPRSIQKETMYEGLKTLYGLIGILVFGIRLGYAAPDPPDFFSTWVLNTDALASFTGLPRMSRNRTLGGDLAGARSNVSTFFKESRP